jgi:PAS domain S-box-containing protein
MTGPRIHERLSRLNTEVERLISPDDLSAMSHEETTDRLREALEELRVAEEELIAQNEELVEARRRVEAQRHRYQDLFDFAPDAYLITDLHGGIIEANDTAHRVLRVPGRFLNGKPLGVFVAPEDKPRLRALIRRVLEVGRVGDVDLRVHPRDAAEAVPMSATVAALPTSGAPTALRWLLHDVSGRVAAQQGLARINEQLETRVRARTSELEHANAAKDEFLGLVSHELRTPITVILGNAEVLQNRASHLGQSDRVVAVGDILGEAGRLSRIVDNLLVLARLQGGQYAEREPVIVQHVVERVVAEHCARYPQRDVRAIVGGSGKYVEASVFAIEQVLRNLLSNAEKYSPSGEPIEVAVSRTDDEVSVVVRDHGIGVAAEDVARLFTPFYRAPSGRRHAQGVGIGLAVCKRLVEAQEGRIWAATRREGGFEIGFALPVADEFAEERDVVAAT